MANIEIVQKEYLGVDQAGLMTGMSPWTWRRWAYAGKVASVKLGNRLLIPRAEIERLINENTRPALVVVVPARREVIHG